MSKHVRSDEGFTLKDLMSNEGLTIDIADYMDNDDDEVFSYKDNVHLTNEELLKLLNIEEFDDNNEDGQNDITMLSSMSFDKFKPKMTDILGNNKIFKLVKKEGVGEVVPSDAQVTVKYVGYFEYHDEPFDSTYIRGRPEILRLGQSTLIVGLEAAIKTMKKHEVAVFLIHPDFAYGKLGIPPRIPPNEEVLFIVNLIDYLDNGSIDTYKILTPEERKIFKNITRHVNDMLTTAKHSISIKKNKQAIKEYRTAIKWLEDAELFNDEEEKEMNKLLSKAYTNLAICYNKEGQSRLACSACNKVPIPTSKTFFNHGRAMIQIGECKKALQLLENARRMEPNNKEILKEIHLANQKIKAYQEVEKRMWSNCLKTDHKKELTKFQKAARDLCDTFARDPNNLRQPLPESLSPEEEKYITEQAAALGLCVTRHMRYGKETIYLNKPNY